ncbi:MFS transporter [Streptomyces sp. CB02400]|uniref:MFS transporter n=1 Tax=Streptomyces sp. CB02400 TaxID=1703944 RepID=UPI00093A853E|nr:MFS transporter [Streptomyces sp. CB02400]OKK08924.1 MFS transporter [Streptomyces sp. CB02400]
MGTDRAGATAGVGDGRAGRREWAGLAVLALPTLLVSIDVFVLLLALPKLSTDLGADSTEQLWITDIYAFMLAGFLITTGTLGDRIGRRRLLLTGAVAFGAASVLAAYADSPGTLIAARALLGIAGATLAPSTMALITNLFRDPGQRAVAISIWMVCLTGGATIGPLVGGAMLEHFWWGSVFLLGVPAMALLLVLGPVLLPEYRAPRAGRLDPASVALSLAALLPAAYGLKELARAGRQPVPVLAVVAGAAAGVVFALRQWRLADPLLDLRLFADRAFSTALGTMFFNTLLVGATMLFVTEYLQLVEGLTPFRAGLCMLPAMVGSVVGSLLAPVVARRIRPAYVIGTGLLVAAAGLLLLTRADAGPGPGLTAVVTGFALMNTGGGPAVVLGTDLVVGSAPLEKAGSAASMNETSGQFGFALGLATLGSLATAVYRHRIEGAVPDTAPPAAAEAAGDTLAGAVSAAEQLPGQAGAALLSSARDAFTGGMHVAAGVSSVLLTVVAVLVVALLRHVRPGGEIRERRDVEITESVPTH